MQWLPDDFLNIADSRKAFLSEAGSFLMEKTTTNTEHILKGGVVTYYLLSEKLFLSQKYDFLRKV